MEQIITSIIASLSPSALPLVVVIVAGLYFLYKFKSIEQDRITTKQQRDTDSQDVHDKILKLEFKMTELSGIVNLHRDKLDQIERQLCTVNEQLIRLNMSVEHLSASMKEQNEIMKKQLNKEK
ncbi:hypothetical protein [Pseudobutyrivibrio sp.]|jgi:peptidoglycan hydrolase CwlO-like protein|uniref:hypothetical protein n=1 Tax=Pseudobutyrivibrio sp. TaxID=2014367 RepID=UPI0025EF649C|nr:hypothetical protein [Pseudobutyrivibrio sp.]